MSNTKFFLDEHYECYFVHFCLVLVNWYLTGYPQKFDAWHNEAKVILMYYHSGKFIWANPKISSSFSPIFPSFVYLVSTKPLAKWSKSPAQLSGGHWVEYKAEFWFFFFQIFEILQIFIHFICFKFSAKSSKVGSFSYESNTIQSTYSPIL